MQADSLRYRVNADRRAGWKSWLAEADRRPAAQGGRLPSAHSALAAGPVFPPFIRVHPCPISDSQKKWKLFRLA